MLSLNKECKSSEALRRAKKKYYEKLKRENPEKLEKYKKNRKHTYRHTYICKCCGTKCNARNAFMKHLKTKKHSKNYELYEDKDNCIGRIKI